MAVAKLGVRVMPDSVTVAEGVAPLGERDCVGSVCVVVRVSTVCEAVSGVRLGDALNDVEAVRENVPVCVGAGVMVDERVLDCDADELPEDDAVAAVRVGENVPLWVSAGVTVALAVPVFEELEVAVAVPVGCVCDGVLADSDTVLPLKVRVPSVGEAVAALGDTEKLTVFVDVPVGCVRDTVAPEGVSVFFVNVRVA